MLRVFRARRDVRQGDIVAVAALNVGLVVVRADLALGTMAWQHRVV